MYNFQKFQQYPSIFQFPYYQVYWAFPMSTLMPSRGETLGAPEDGRNLERGQPLNEELKFPQNSHKKQEVPRSKQNKSAIFQQQDQKRIQVSEQKKLAQKDVTKMKAQKPHEINIQNSQKEPKSESRGKWMQNEQEKLKQLVQLFGEHWKQISQHFPDKNPKQIRERYLNYLRPNINHGKWTVGQDDKLIQHVSVYGHHWKFIQKKLKNRSQNQIKNRYYGHVKKIIESRKLKERKLTNIQNEKIQE